MKRQIWRNDEKITREEHTLDWSQYKVFLVLCIQNYKCPRYVSVYAAKITASQQLQWGHNDGTLHFRSACSSVCPSLCVSHCG